MIAADGEAIASVVNGATKITDFVNKGAGAAATAAKLNDRNPLANIG